MNFSAISHSGALGKLLRLPLRIIPNSAVMPILQGRLRGKKWIAGSGDHGCWLGSYELDKQLRFSESVPAGGVVWDVGAHVGFYSLLASVLAGPEGKVVAFEPLPANLEHLHKHLVINNVTNVKVMEGAVGAQPGEATFKTGPSTTRGQISSDGDVKVKVFQLDALVAEGVIPPPAVIKMDIEGGEGDALEGAAETLARHHPQIFLATHGPEVHARCCSFLRQKGYTLTPLDEGGIENCTEILAVAN